MTDRFKGESEPIATNPILRGVDLAMDRLVRRDAFTERTITILDELRAEVLGVTTAEEVRSHYFEEAHTPTDDEREALREQIAYRIRDAVAYGEAAHRSRESSMTQDAWIKEQVALAMRSRAVAGFRRSEVPEPSAEEWAARIQAARAKAIAKGYTPDHDAEHGIRHLLNWAIDYARRGRPEDSSGLILSALALLDAEPQGEPSDAVVKAAVIALDGQITFDLMRAALRAAAEAKRGENRG